MLNSIVYKNYYYWLQYNENRDYMHYAVKYGSLNDNPPKVALVFDSKRIPSQEEFTELVKKIDENELE